jgi:hypothetical protein
MKKILFLIVTVCLVAVTSKAQYNSGPIRVDKTKTISAADTTVLSNVEDDVVSYQYTYVEGSGTSAGKIYIEGTVDGIAWKHIDSSLVLSDVATAQSVIGTLTATTYRSYRARCSNTSSATATIYFTLLRRPEDRLPSPSPVPIVLSRTFALPPVLLHTNSKYMHAPLFNSLLTYKSWTLVPVLN